MPIEIINELTSKAMGGTELMAYELQRRLDPELLDKFQIIPSRVRNLDDTRKKIYWCHDLPQDPESEHLKQGGYNKFDRLVFVSNWQMQRYIEMYDIPWHKCVVIQNAIRPLDLAPNWSSGPVKLIYHTTPHRGLDILLNVFDRLIQDGEDITLDVYSSFKIYGWEERDEQFKRLFEYADAHPRINNHGSVPNDEVRAALSSSHIFAYPSKWPETSCLALLEAMSAGLTCVHSNYAALPETSANWTRMYQYHQVARDHAAVLYGQLKAAIESVRLNAHVDLNFNQKAYTDLFYSWDLRAANWDRFLRSLL